MTRITRYTLGEILVPALLALCVLGFVGVANELRERIGEFDVAQINVADIGQLALWFLPTLIHIVFPAMYMLGIMLAFGRMAQNNEIMAMKAAGIPLRNIVLPVVLLGAVLSGAAFYVQDQLQPMALRRINDLIYTELPRRISMDVLTPGRMHVLGNWRVYIGGRDRAEDTLHDLDIIETRENGEVWLYHADTARFTTEGGRARLLIRDGYLFMPGEGGRAALPRFTLFAPVPEARPAPNSRRMLTLAQLLDENKNMKRAIVSATSLKSLEELAHLDVVEHPDRIPEGVSVQMLRDLHALHREIRERVGLPLACLALSLVAAPLAARSGPAGRTYSFAIGFAVLLAYYVLWIGLQPLGLVGLREAILRGLAPNLIMVAVGLWAVWRVDRV